MNTYEFELKFKLAEASDHPGQFVEQLAESGCTDALVGIGQNGRIAFHFSRDADSALDAVLSAITHIKSAIPGVTLIEAAPDLVGLTDVADMLGCSRQNIRKLMMNHQLSFPAPVHEGKTVLWHLSSILTWLKQRNRYRIDDQLWEIANTNMQLNMAKESTMMDASMQKQLLARM
jgi:predicted DNA-binding transcriptional regulator AlpA